MVKMRQWGAAVKKFLDGFFITGGVLLVVGALLYALATIPRVSWLHDLGTALFVAGLSLVISTKSGQEAVRQQHAKDANVERKNALYAPLYSELRQLWERFERATTGEAPYPHWIEGAGEIPGYTQLNPYIRHPSVPSFTKWQEFKNDHHINDFSPTAQALLNDLQERVTAYSTAVAATEEPNVGTLAPRLATAMDAIIESHDYQEWQKQVKAGTRMRVDVDSWYEQVTNSIQGTASPAAVHAEAALWLDNFGARGWLLAGKPDTAALSAREVYGHVSVPTPPPLAWFQDIFQSVWPEIDGLAVNQQARQAAAAVLQKVRETKDHFDAGFLSIRDKYEGGTPPI